MVGERDVQVVGERDVQVAEEQEVQAVEERDVQQQEPLVKSHLPPHALIYVLIHIEHNASVLFPQEHFRRE